MPVLLGAVLIAVAAGVGSWLAGRRAAARHRARRRPPDPEAGGGTAGNLTLPVDRFFTPFALSPDGERLVFRARGNGRSQLFLRELSGFEARPIPGTETATTPFFSPDGQLDRLLASGGSHPPKSLARGRFSDRNRSDRRTASFALWTSNDEIVIESGDPNGELWSIPASGGTPKAIAVRDRSDGEWISLRARVPGSNDLLVASPGDRRNLARCAVA